MKEIKQEEYAWFDNSFSGTVIDYYDLDSLNNETV